MTRISKWYVIMHKMTIEPTKQNAKIIKAMEKPTH